AMEEDGANTEAEWDAGGSCSCGRCAATGDSDADSEETSAGADITGADAAGVCDCWSCIAAFKCSSSNTRWFSAFLRFFSSALSAAGFLPANFSASALVMRG